MLTYPLFSEFRTGKSFEKHILRMGHGMTKIRKKILQVAVFLDPLTGAIQEILYGIHRYMKLYGPQELHLVRGNVAVFREEISRKSRGRPLISGILAHVPNREIEEIIGETTIPTVLIDPCPSYLEVSHPLFRTPSVLLDNEKIADMAADFFLRMKMPYYAFVPSVPDGDWSQTRLAFYSKALAAKGHNVHVFRPSPPNQSPENKKLAQWLSQLPKPAAILVPSDVTGRRVLQVCHDSKIVVPYEVAVLGIGNDVAMCDSCFPSLSSIAVHSQRAGFVAAELLDQLMNRVTPLAKTITYDPTEVVPRDSTNLPPDMRKSQTGQSSGYVIRALEFIRINNGCMIQVEEVAKHVGVSRQWLEKQFKNDMGHSLHGEIHRHKMSRICSLLTETETPINQIAEMSGFENANHLRIIFKKEFGMTMTEYRQQRVGMR